MLVYARANLARKNASTGVFGGRHVQVAPLGGGPFSLLSILGFREGGGPPVAGDNLCAPAASSSTENVRVAGDSSSPRRRPRRRRDSSKKYPRPQRDHPSPRNRNSRGDEARFGRCSHPQKPRISVFLEKTPRAVVGRGVQVLWRRGEEPGGRTNGDRFFPRRPRGPAASRLCWLRVLVRRPALLFSTTSPQLDRRVVRPGLGPSRRRDRGLEESRLRLRAPRRAGRLRARGFARGIRRVGSEMSPKNVDEVVRATAT